VTSGRLPAGTRLPGTRGLADDLGIARGTVVAAYAQLVAEGWLVSATGSGTRVADVALPPAARAVPVRPVIDLRPGRPDLSLFPHAQWSAAVKRSLAAAAAGSMDYGDPAGSRALREAVATYVSRARGVRAEPEAVVITSGFTHALAVLSRALRDAGAHTIATEDPGLAHHRRLIHGAGLSTAPLRVGPDGADPAGIPSRAGAVLLTPAHQHPRGVVLSHEARTAFLAWADEHDGFVVEDDYDGEFRYDRHAAGALQALDPERVVFAGSASKALAPGLRLGWLVVPARLIDPISSLRIAEDVHVPAPDQIALCQLLRSGAYERHVRRMRARYRARRDRLVAMLAERAPALVPVGISAGLGVLLELPEGGPSCVELLAEADRRSLALFPLGPHYRSGSAPRDGVVIGYGALPEHDFEAGLRALGALLEDLLAG
jgi:GntR family transcriptional regulator/MocR family aminotransferase